MGGVCGEGSVLGGSRHLVLLLWVHAWRVVASGSIQEGWVQATLLRSVTHVIHTLGLVRRWCCLQKAP